MLVCVVVSIAPAQPTPTPADAETIPGDFVSAPNLAKSLRQIDPKTKISWDDKSSTFFIQVADQKFSLKLTQPPSNEITVNGIPRPLKQPMRLSPSDNEFYLPAEAVEIIGAELERAKGGTASAPTVAATPGTSSTSSTPAPASATVAPAAPTPVRIDFPELVSTPVPEPTRRVAATPVTETPTAVAPMSDGDPLPGLIRERGELSRLLPPTRTLRDLTMLTKSPRLKRVVLDADDSTLIDPQANVRQRKIADINLAVVRQVRARLTAKGVEVVQLRAGSERTSHRQKLEGVLKQEAQALVTISVGQAESVEANGCRSFYPSDSIDAVYGKASEQTEGESVALEQTFRPFQEKSEALAAALLQAMRPVSAAGAVGSAPAPLWLGRRAPMASAHIVIGYITNPGDAARLNDPAELTRMGDALAEGILQFGEHLASTATLAPVQGTKGVAP